MERYKEMCEALERERESLGLSLKSSERIRKQQKDLIKLLQENGGRVSGHEEKVRNARRRGRRMTTRMGI